MVYPMSDGKILQEISPAGQKGKLIQKSGNKIAFACGILLSPGPDKQPDRTRMGLRRADVSACPAL